MSSVLLAEEQSQHVIASLKELLEKTQAGNIKGYLVVESGCTQDNFHINGQHGSDVVWELAGDFDNTNVYLLFAKLFESVTGMTVYLT